MLPYFLMVSAVVPSLLLVGYFYAKDARPEPGKVILATLALGVLTIPGVLLVALPFSAMIEALKLAPVPGGIADAFLTAAIPEETLKLAVVWLYCSRNRAFDEPMDGIVYGAVASLGFASLENVLYVMGGGFGLAVLRALTAVPAHAF